MQIHNDYTRVHPATARSNRALQCSSKFKFLYSYYWNPVCSQHLKNIATIEQHSQKGWGLAHNRFGPPQKKGDKPWNKLGIIKVRVDETSSPKLWNAVFTTIVMKSCEIFLTIKRGPTVWNRSGQFLCGDHIQNKWYGRGLHALFHPKTYFVCKL